MRVIKSELHQVERRYATDIDIDFLAQVYFDMSDKELNEAMNRLESGELTIKELMEDAKYAWYEINWESLDEDSWEYLDVIYEIEND